MFQILGLPNVSLLWVKGCGSKSVVIYSTIWARIVMVCWLASEVDLRVSMSTMETVWPMQSNNLMRRIVPWSFDTVSQFWVIPDPLSNDVSLLRCWTSRNGGKCSHRDISRKQVGFQELFLKVNSWSLCLFHDQLSCRYRDIYFRCFGEVSILLKTGYWVSGGQLVSVERWRRVWWFWLHFQQVCLLAKVSIESLLPKLSFSTGFWQQ